MSKRQDLIVMVLLSAHAERVGVSRMRKFFIRTVDKLREALLFWNRRQTSIRIIGIMYV